MLLGGVLKAFGTTKPFGLKTWTSPSAQSFSTPLETLSPSAVGSKPNGSSKGSRPRGNLMKFTRRLLFYGEAGRDFKRK
jgi:hypothetical protein